jgi:carboxymethylenebutenolidase
MAAPVGGPIMQDDVAGLPVEGLDVRLARRGFVMTGLIAGFTLATTRVEAQAIHTDAAGLDAGPIGIPVADGKLPAYFARPAGRTNLPIILVVEEIFGVHEYIKDVCRRLAKLGYLAVAPELYARIGDLSKMTDAAQIVRDVISKAPDATVMSDLDATAAWAAANGGNAAAVGIVGFCRGGRAVWLYNAHNPDLRAAVAFYGPLGGERTAIQPQTALDVAGAIHAPQLNLYGAKDGSIPQDAVSAAAAKAKAAGKTVEVVVYPDAGHGFHADYRPSYVAADAADGWNRAIAWFRAHGLG